jgi:hypothetical protein
MDYYCFVSVSGYSVDVEVSPLVAMLGMSVLGSVVLLQFFCWVQSTPMVGGLDKKSLTFC